MKLQFFDEQADIPLASWRQIFNVVHDSSCPVCQCLLVPGVLESRIDRQGELHLEFNHRQCAAIKEARP